MSKYNGFYTFLVSTNISVFKFRYKEFQRKSPIRLFFCKIINYTSLIHTQI